MKANRLTRKGPKARDNDGIDSLGPRCLGEYRDILGYEIIDSKNEGVGSLLRVLSRRLAFPEIEILA